MVVGVHATRRGDLSGGQKQAFIGPSRHSKVTSRFIVLIVVFFSLIFIFILFLLSLLSVRSFFNFSMASFVCLNVQH